MWREYINGEKLRRLKLSDVCPVHANKAVFQRQRETDIQMRYNGCWKRMIQ